MKTFLLSILPIGLGLFILSILWPSNALSSKGQNEIQFAMDFDPFQFKLIPYQEIVGSPNIISIIENGKIKKLYFMEAMHVTHEMEFQYYHDIAFMIDT